MDTTRKLWWGLSTLLIVTFAIMLWMGREIHQQAPPLPSKIVTESGQVVFTRQELETRVWGEELPDSDSLRVHIHGLRAVVDKPFDSHFIQTRHGIGYRIAAPDA